MEQQKPDGFSAHLRNQSPFYRLFSDQPHRPASTAGGRIAADHCDDALPLCWLQQSHRAGPLFVVKSLLQTRRFVPSSNLAHSLGSQWNQGSDFGGRPALIQLLQRQRPKHGTNRLHSAAEHPIQLIAIRLLQAHFQPPISPHAPG